MYSRLIFVFILFAITSCMDTETNLTINSAEKIGFNKEKQQLFQMIGAVDGWAGIWEGEIVELYQFENSEKIQTDLFATSTDNGNISGWVDKCVVGNMLMLSKGKNACIKLHSLIEQ